MTCAPTKSHGAPARAAVWQGRALWQGRARAALWQRTALWFGVALSTGCADWLGLSELSFEEPAPAESADPEGGAGAGGAAPELVLPEEEAAATPQESLDFDDFAASWPAGALAAFESAQSSALYWVYDPGERRLSTYRLRQGDDLVGARPWATDLLWTHVEYARGPDGPMLIGYDASSGLLERLTNFSPNGGFEVERSAGNRHSHFLVGSWKGEAVLVGYQQETGFYRVVPAHAKGSRPVLQGNLWQEEGLACDQVVFARVERTDLSEDAAGVLCYEQSTGSAHFLAFDEPEGSAATGRLQWQAEAEWASGLVVASSGASDSTELFRYEPTEGRLERSSWAVESGVLVRKAEPASSSVRLGLTRLWPFQWRDWPAVVTFDGSTADLRFVGLPGSDWVVR